MLSWIWFYLTLCVDLRKRNKLKTRFSFGGNTQWINNFRIELVIHFNNHGFYLKFRVVHPGTSRTSGQVLRYWLNSWILFITVRKRSLRTVCFHRCLSVHRGVSAKRGVQAQAHARGRGGLPREGCPSPGLGVGVQAQARGGVQAQAQGCVQALGECVSQHAVRQTLPPPPAADGYCCGRYTSYWNAFLFHKVSVASVNASFELL